MLRRGGVRKNKGARKTTGFQSVVRVAKTPLAVVVMLAMVMDLCMPGGQAGSGAYISEAVAEATAPTEGAAANGSTNAESAETTAEQHGPVTLTKEFHSADGNAYVVSVDCPAEAKVPKDAELSLVEVNRALSEEEQDPNRPSPTERFVDEQTFGQVNYDVKYALGATSSYVFYEKLLDIKILAKGEEVRPECDVRITVSSGAVGEADSDCMRAAVYDDNATKQWHESAGQREAERAGLSEEDRAALPQDPSRVFRALDVTNETAPGEGTKISFSTGLLGEFGFAGVAAERASWEAEGTRVAVYGSESADVQINEAEAPQPTDGLEVVAAIRVDAQVVDHGANIWLKATGLNGEASPRGHAIHDGEIADELFGAAGTQDPIAIEPGCEIALVRDVAQQPEDIPAEDSSPEEGQGDKKPGDVNADASDTAKSKEDQTKQESPKPKDESREEEKDEASADPNETTISQSSEPDDLTLMEDLQKSLVASSGQRYVVSMSYGPEAGIPSGSTLEVRELTGEEYRGAQARAEMALETTSQKVASLRAFDITIRDAMGNQVEPLSPVSISIQLEGTAQEGESSVVHIDGLASEVIKPTVTTDGAKQEIEFEAKSFSVYAVVQTIKELTLTASNGKTYKVSVVYDSTSGIPEDANLQVVELAQESAEYADYVDKAAKALDREARQLSFAHAFDIALVDPKTGDHYQPNDKVKVNVELLGEKLSDGDEGAVSVVHFPGSTAQAPSEAEESEVLETAVQGGVVEFASNSFSVYVVTRKALLKHYVFLNDTDGHLNISGNQALLEGDSANWKSYIFAEQVLANGESVVEAPMPVKSGAVFEHWSSEVGGTAATFPVVTKLKESDIPGADLSEKQSWLDEHPTFYYAVYGKGRTVITYYNQSGQIVEKEEYYKPSAGEAAIEVDTREVTYLPVQDKEGTVITFEYWTDDPNGEGAEVGNGSGKISITANSENEISLYPYLNDGHYIYFDANKSTYGMQSADFTASETVTNGTDAAGVCTSLNSRSNNAIPAAEGYVFAGWYESASKTDFEAGSLTPVFEPSADGKTLVVNTEAYNSLLDNFGNLAYNPTLYAHWTKVETAPYAVVIWRQKLTDDGTAASESYAFAESEVVENASTTEETTISSKYAQKATNVDKTSDYYGFEYNAGKSDTKITVESDGSTVANVYYDRIVHTLTFKNGTDRYSRTTDTSGTQYGYVDGEYVKLTYSNGVWTYRATVYEYVVTDSKESGNYYIRQNNRYTQTYLYRHNDKWYRSYNWYYGYYDEYTGDIYERVETKQDVEYTGTRYINSAVVKTITAAYGTDISSYFPIVGDDGTVYEEQRWKDVNAVEYGEVIGKLFTMPNNDIEFKSDTTTNSYVNLYYYTEALSGETTGLRTFNGKQYSLYQHIKIKYGYVTEAEDYYDFPGFTHAGTDPAFNSSGRALTNHADGASMYFYYNREPYSIYFRDSRGGNDPFAAANIKYQQAIPNYNDSSNGHIPSDDTLRFTGWYMDKNCTTRLFFTQADYDASDLPATAKECITNMPGYNLQIYAGWMSVKNRAILEPNYGEMNGQGLQFHLNPEEKIGVTDLARDYVPVENGTGAYIYDTSIGSYIQTEDNTGNFNAKAGAYIFQGWYEAELKDPGEKKIIEYKPGRYSYAFGDYQNVGEGNGSYIKKGDTYSLVGKGNGSYDFVNAKPKKDKMGNYVVKRVNGRQQKYDLATAPTAPITLVALWQRAGGFRVVYNVVDPSLNLDPSAYSGIAAPEDQEDYMDNSHAVVLPEISTPVGYKLKCWVDKNGNEYKPNAIVPVNEANATASGSEMLVTLTAKYVPYEPVERTMADYLFMTNTKTDGSGHVSLVDDYSKYELQRIAVNEELKPPLTPAVPEGYVFKGWYFDKAGTRLFNGFGKIANPTYTTLYAVFSRVFTVNYYLTDSSTQQPTNTVIATQTYDNPGPGLADSNYKFLDTRHINHPVDLDHYVTMWTSDWAHKDEANYQYPYNTLSKKRVKGDINLYAILKERNYVRFDSCGGSYVETKEIPTGSGCPVRPEDPTRKGFEFKGWYTAKEGGNKYEFKSNLAQLEGFTGTLYAHWESDGSATGTVHVIFWAQTATRPEDEEKAAADYNSYQMINRKDLENIGYGDHSSDELKSMLGEYLESDAFDIVKTTQQGWNADFEEAKAFVNDALGYKGNNADVVPNWRASNYIEDLSNYYSYNATKSSEVVSVDESDTAVLNVRFDLKTYYLQFLNAGKAAITYDGTSYPATSTNYYTVPVWLNRPISEQWPVDKSVNPNRTGAYLEWNESNKVFDNWKMTVDVASTTSCTLSKVENKAFYTTVTLADKLLIDSISKYGTNNVLPVTPASKTKTNYKAVVHYLTRNGNLTTFKEVTELQTVIYVPGRPSWATYDLTGYRSGSNYHGFVYSVCNVHENNHHGSDYHKFAYGLLEPVGLSGYVGLDNETAHLGDLYNEDGTLDDGLKDDKNISLLYNLISSRKGLAHVVFDTEDPTYANYFANHQDQYVSADNTYNFYFYYKPLSYTLNFYKDASTQVGSSKTVYCGASLSSAISDIGTPEAPSEYVSFAGWALSPYQTSEDAAYTGTVMPSHNLNLYAIWKPVSHTVTTVGVDANGNPVAEEQSATYTATHNQQLRELGIPHPIAENKLFKGWLNADTGTSVTGVLRVTSDIRIKPSWTSLDVRRVTYDANFPDPLPSPFTETPPTAPTDSNQYVLGAKVTIKGSNGLYINRVDVDGKVYRAGFAYWEDDDGNRYYPNTTYIFRESSPEVLALKAVYSEYRETVLTYDKNAEDAKFVYVDGSGSATSDYPADKLTGEGTLNVLFRDQLNKSFDPEKDKIPNVEFSVAQDRDGDNFTVIRTDEEENVFILVGWATADDKSYPIAENGDRAYVNTIKKKVNGQDVLLNTLYAVWGVCKIEHNNKEHVFDSISSAVEYARERLDGTATIQMLVDYKLPKSDAVSIAEGDNITLTTAARTGGKYNYVGHGENDRALITRGTKYTTRSMFVVGGGSFATTNVTLDGGAAFTVNADDGSVISSATKGQVDLSGNMINASAGNVTVGAGTTIQNSAVNLNGGNVRAGGSIFIASGANLTIDGESNSTAVHFAKCFLIAGHADIQGGAAAYVDSNALVVRYASFDNCVSTKAPTVGGGGQGGAIFHNGEAADSSTTIHNSSFTKCRSSWAGGAIESDAAHITVSGTTFNNCKAADDGEQGGAILTYQIGSTNSSNTTLTISDCTFEECSTLNTSKKRSGGAVGSTAYTTTVSNSTFTNCSATAEGGGIALISTNGTASGSILGCTFTSCTANNGGGIYSKIKQFSIDCLTEGDADKRTTLTGCSAKSLGGAMYIDQVLASSSASIKGALVDKCLASSQGSGIAYKSNQTDCTLTIANSGEVPTTVSECGKSNDGGGVYAEGSNKSAKLAIEGNTSITKCLGKYGAGVYLKNGVICTMQDSASVSSCTNAEEAGGVFVDYKNAGDSSLTLKGNASVTNCKASKTAGAVFVRGVDSNVANFVIEGSPSITGNSATTAPGVYINSGTLCTIQGSPNFGGESISSATGNLSTNNLASGKYNGKEAYTKARQDLYLVGYENTIPATSLVVTGDITSGDGTIWVWAEKNPHYKADNQFALLTSEDSLENAATSLKAFRNAQDDLTTDNQTSSYLYGVKGTTDDERLYVKWSPRSIGNRHVILRKVDGSAYTSLKGAKFKLYQSDRETLVLEDELVSNDNGIFYAGMLAYGTYYFQETAAPTAAGYEANKDKWFKIVVDENGVTNPAEEDAT